MALCTPTKLALHQPGERLTDSPPWISWEISDANLYAKILRTGTSFSVFISLTLILQTQILLRKATKFKKREVTCVVFNMRYGTVIIIHQKEIVSDWRELSKAGV